MLKRCIYGRADSIYNFDTDITVITKNTDGTKYRNIVIK